MKRNPATVIGSIFGVAVAAALGVLSHHLFTDVGDGRSYFVLIAAVATSVVAVVLLILSLGRLMAQPGAAILPQLANADLNRSTPSYRLPELLARQGRFDEALQEYREIAAQYPEEVRPIVGMLSVALVDQKDPLLASEIYQRASDGLSDQDARRELWRRYRELGSRVDESEFHLVDEPGAAARLES